MSVASVNASQPMVSLIVPALAVLIWIRKQQSTQA
jgi:hypothetical protein